ncbi:kinesin-like protein KIF6 [Tachyglossus aculeatus]|uniref:kinesin-like protein KIF6 n=1 Tax=Tachyglossus aculeatus TaxID=9261 RepID=UPI0018F2FB8D|nr:kinesin-like protein KIF6 [Tachyglossus aculeatus]
MTPSLRVFGIREEMSLGCQEAFEIFKRDHADSITIDDNKQLLKQRFAEAKALGENVNETRNKISHLKGEITQRQMQRAAFGVANIPMESMDLDQVEEKLRAQMEEEKKSYKTMFNRLKGLKVEIEHLQLLMEKAKVKLQKEFEAWWAAETSNLQENPPPTTHSTSSWKSSPSTLESQHQPEGRRVSESSSSSIPLTGDSQTDADILAFVRARQNLMQKKGLGKNF